MANILLVDDDDQLRRYLSTCLKSAGHSVYGAPDGNKALQAIQKASFDLIITDVAMPEMDGLQLIRKVGTKLPGAKILAIAGASVDGPDLHLGLARHFGADSILSKPFGPGRFKEVVSSLLSR